MKNYNDAQAIVEGVNQMGSSVTGQYEYVIGLLQKKQTQLEPFVNPNSRLLQALNRRLKSVPKDDENAQLVMRGLRYFRTMYNTLVNDISILQKANDAEVSGDESELASINDKVNAVLDDLDTLNEQLTEILSRPELKGLATL